MLKLKTDCEKRVAGLALGVFVVAFLVFLFLADFGFIASVFLGALIALLTGIVLYVCLCVPGGAVPAHSASSGDSSGAQAAADAKAAESAEAARQAEAQRQAEAARQAEAEAKRKAAEEKAAEEAAATAATAAAPVSAPATTEAGEDYDGDGVHEGADEGTRPAGLDAPRDGKADDLKQIKGVGPKMETLCNSLGFWHFDQIASWTADEVAWVDANLTGFKGRVSRDEWVEQAKILAGGGETEFSKRVEDGDVY